MNDSSIPKTQPRPVFLEIERKFLVKEDLILPILQDPSTKKIAIKQGYIAKNELGSVRVRIQGDPDALAAPTAFLMSKTKVDNYMSNEETEDEIGLSTAQRLLSKFSINYISKIRYIIDVGGKKWEVDVFEKPNAGLILAEIELTSADEIVILPEWIGLEVTGISKYYNANM